jgi:predicted DNA-binding helix-hairpin-helix protein
MNIHRTPDTLEKLTRMGDVTLYEPAGDTPHDEGRAAVSGSTPRERYQSRSLAECISHVATPTGSKPILKTMVTTACEKNCYYCPFRAGRAKTGRYTFKPDELAGAFDQIQRSGAVDGFFLSSGIIKGGVTTQDKIIDTVEIIRRRYAYSGYVHLKIMPGAEYDQIGRALQVADRLSINLEAPSQARMDALAPKKNFEDELLKRLLWANEIRQRQRAEGRKVASLVTQFVVGAVGDTDLELLSMSERLYRQAGLARVYYSAFHPVAQTPLEEIAPVPLVRQNRLYQASFLLRDYGWEVEELPFVEAGNLRLDVDPKRAWADVHLRANPIDLMRAERHQLMRVPGIGARGADAILAARRRGRLTDIGQLRALGIRGAAGIAPYVLLAGRAVDQQMRLF